MRDTHPRTGLASDFSSPGAAPTHWETCQESLASADVYWLSTVRPDGRPHVTPLIAMWHDGSLWFCIGASERKAKNLAANPACVITTGTNAFDGLDVVVEGDAVRVTDDARL